MGMKNLRVMVDALQPFACCGTLAVKDLSEALKMPRSTAHRLAPPCLRCGSSKRPTRTAPMALGPLVGEGRRAGRLPGARWSRNAGPRWRRCAIER
jgi:hypothetical protein